MRNLFLLFCILLVGCGKEDSTSPTPPRNVSGNYTANLQLAGAIVEGGVTAPLTCTGSLDMRLDQSPDEVVGNFGIEPVICSVEGESFAVDWSGMVEGTLEGTTLTLTDGFCEYMGTVSTGNHVEGTATCREVGDTYVVTLSGPWHLSP